jgi:hypothetical protein
MEGLSNNLTTLFARPMFLTLLALLPLIWWRWSRPGRRAAVRFSTLAPLRDAGCSWAVRARHIVPVLRSLTLMLLIVWPGSSAEGQ